MIHPKEPTAVLTAIIIALVALGTLAFVVFVRLQAVGVQATSQSASALEMSGWDAYRNDQYGFQVSYPPEWNVSTDGLDSENPFVALGNPLSGLKTYTMYISIENNSSSLSVGEYVHNLLDATRAADMESGADKNLAPRTTPQFELTQVFDAGSSNGYELYGVFEFDHLAERMYVAHGSEVLRFDFPVAQENPNISLPVANNSIAHQIVNSLVFTR